MKEERLNYFSLSLRKTISFEGGRNFFSAALRKRKSVVCRSRNSGIAQMCPIHFSVIDAILVHEAHVLLNPTIHMARSSACAIAHRPEITLLTLKQYQQLNL